LIPVLVIVVVSPAANAAFYAAWTLAAFLKILPAHLSTVLFAVAAADPQVIARKLRFTLRVSLLVGIPGMIVLGLGAHLALSMFGPGYARAATIPLVLLVISYIPSIPKVHYMAVCRATGQIPRAAAVLTVAAAAEVTAAAAGGAAGGLKGLALALLAVYIGEGLVTTPLVVRAAMGHGRHRQADSLSSAVGSLMNAARSWGREQGRAGSHSLEQAKREHRQALLPTTSGPNHGPEIPAGPRGQETGTVSHAEPAGHTNNQQEAGIAALLSLARGQVGLPSPDADAGQRESA
jgi:hypothetical protein